MDQERRKTREKRYRNRLRIAVILLTIFVAVAVAGWVITQRLIVFPGFIFLVGVAYLIAALWERRELKNK